MEETGIAVIEEKSTALVLETKDLKVLEVPKAQKIVQTFQPMAVSAGKFETEFSEIISKSETEITTELCAQAKKLRLEIRKVRTATENLRVAEKADYVLAGKAVDGVASLIKLSISNKEEVLENIETHFERIEKEKKELVAVERTAQLAIYDPELLKDTKSFNALDLVSMAPVVWDAFLENKKIAYEKKQEQSRIEEENRIKQEAEEKAKRDLEIEKQKELIKKQEEEKRIKEEEAQKEKEASEEKQRQEKAIADQKAIDDQIEKDRIQKELDDAKEKIRLEEVTKLAKQKADYEEQQKKKLELAQQAKLPEKKRITDWIQSFVLPPLAGNESQVSKQIQDLFEKFKATAQKLNEGS